MELRGTLEWSSLTVLLRNTAIVRRSNDPGARYAADIGTFVESFVRVIGATSKMHTQEGEEKKITIR